MRWVRCATPGGARLGVLVDDAVRLLDSDVSLVDLLAPLERPPSVRDFMAFEQHVEGVGRLAGAGVPDIWYEQPLFYFSNPAAVVGAAGSDLTLPKAEAAIAGYLIMNDWSARDLQFAELRGRSARARARTRRSPSAPTSSPPTSSTLAGGVRRSRWTCRCGSTTSCSAPTGSTAWPGRSADAFLRIARDNRAPGRRARLRHLRPRVPRRALGTPWPRRACSAATGRRGPDVGGGAGRDSQPARGIAPTLAGVTHRR